jgi:signal transduction histidine kinase
MDADQIVFCMEEIALSDLADSSWQTFSARAVERGLTFDNRIPKDLTLTCDRQSLGVVFSNLLDNAVEYADRGGRIWIQAQKGDSLVEIVAANTGCRLNPDQTARVFDRFWRADPSRSDAGTHCGLGLSLVLRIAQAMGGSISAAVEDGTFIVRLRLPCSTPPVCD